MVGRGCNFVVCYRSAWTELKGLMCLRSHCEHMTSNGVGFKRLLCLPTDSRLPAALRKRHLGRSEGGLSHSLTHLWSLPLHPKENRHRIALLRKDSFLSWCKTTELLLQNLAVSSDQRKFTHLPLLCGIHEHSTQKATECWYNFNSDTVHYRFHSTRAILFLTHNSPVHHWKA